MDDTRLAEQVELIRQVFSYQSRFDEKVMVIKIDHPVMESAAFPILIKDLAMLRQTGIQIVIVTSSKERIDEVLERYGVETSFEDGVRIASPESMPFIEMAAFDSASRFMTLFSAHKVSAVLGNFVRARAIGVIGGVDFQRTGRIERINAEPVCQLMDMGQVPVFPCIGWSSSGKPYNISSSELALALAEALAAVKLFFVTVDPGLSSRDLALPPEAETAEDGRVVKLSMEQAVRIGELNRDKKSRGLEYLRLAARAIASGTDRVHIVDGAQEGIILKELFSGLGAGTMVYGLPSDSIRPMKGRDVGEVMRLMKPLVDRGVLIERSEDELRERMPDYAVCESDGFIQGCGALHPYPEESTAEIAALAVNPGYSQQGVGKRLVGYLVDRARALGLAQVFVLTTQTQDWFESLGFRVASPDALPARKREHYNPNRKSRVYVLDIEEYSGPVSRA